MWSIIKSLLLLSTWYWRMQNDQVSDEFPILLHPVPTGSLAGEFLNSLSLQSLWFQYYARHQYQWMTTFEPSIFMANVQPPPPQPGISVMWQNVNVWPPPIFRRCASFVFALWNINARVIKRQNRRTRFKRNRTKSNVNSSLSGSFSSCYTVILITLIIIGRWLTAGRLQALATYMAWLFLVAKWDYEMANFFVVTL